MSKPISLESPDVNAQQPMTTLDQLALSIGMGKTTSNPQNFTFGNAPSSVNTPRPLTALEMNAAFANAVSTGYNPIKMSTPGTFGAGAAGIDMERYMAHPNFESFGVSAFRDNEQFYNQHGTWGSDMIRMGKLIAPAIGDFAAEHLTNYDLNNWSPDLESASAYQEHMHKMMSNKGGVEGWVTNFGANMAPTIGILTGVGIEWAATSLLAAGASRIPILAPVAAELGELEAAKGVKALSALERWKQVRGVVNEFGAAVDVSAARQAFNVTKNGVGYFLKGVNPLANTLEAYQDIQNGSKGLAYLSNMARVSKTFGGMWRDVQGYRFVLNEANLEGGSAYLDQIDNGVRKYQLEHNGEMPTGEAADQILKLAEDNGRAVQWQNMALIHLTNSFGLNKLVGRLGRNAGIRSAFSQNFNKYLVEKSIKGVTGAAGKAGYELLENNIKKWGSKAYYKYLMQTTPSNFLRYFSMNFMEGAQEIGQEAIVKGTEHYFAEQLKDPYKFHKELLKESIATGFGSQMSADGLNVFAQGFLTGGVMNMAQSDVLSPLGNFLYSKWDPKGFKEKLDAAETQANRLLTSANIAFENKAEVFKILDTTAGHLTDMARGSQVAEALGDEHAMRDIKEDSIFSHVYSLWRSGRTDILKEQLKQLGSLEANELADALGESNATPEEKLQMHTRIDKAIKKVDKIKSDLDKFSEKVVNPHQPWEINRKVNPELYQQEYDQWQAFEDGKYFAVFASHSFNRAGERMEGIMEKFISNAAFSKTTGMNIGRLFSVEQMQNDAESLREQSKIYRENNNAKKADELEASATELENLAKNSNLFSVVLGLSNRSEKLTDAEKADLKPILDKALQQGVNLENLTDDDIQEIQDLLKKSFGSYLNDITNKNNNGRTILDAEVDDLFKLYADWHKLGDDTRIMAKWVNMLADPEGFNRLQNVTREARQRVYENRRNILKEQRGRFYKKLIQNKFLQELFNQYGVLVSKEDVEAFANNDRYPQLIDKDTLEPLKANDPRITGIEQLFDMYEEAQDRLVNARPIREDRGENAFLSMLASLANADKADNDKRSYDDLANELGIDPDALETKVESSKVFDFIINSKFSTPAEKKLAQRLKEKYPNAKVTFKKNHHSAMTYNESAGIIIDLRFAASNYQAGKTRAEYIILKGMMTGMTTSFLSEDPEFLKDIQTLKQEVENAINADPSLLDTFEKKMPLGLLSEQEFVNEAMTNPVFQALLNRIKSGEKKKSNAFGDFLKAARAFLKKLFGTKTANNSVLNQAVAVISNKIYSNDYAATKKAPTPPPPPGKPAGAPGSGPAGSATPLTDEEKIKAISQKTAIKDMPQELVDMLDEEYKKIIKSSRGTYSKTGFAAFVKNAPKASSVIEKWKRDELKKLKGPAPTTGGKKGGSTKDDDDDEPVAITDAQRQALYNLGYSRRDIDGYEDEDGEIFQLVEPEDVDEIIRLGLRRSRKVAQGNFEEADAMIAEVRKKLAEKEFPEDKITDKGYTDENGTNWPRVSELLNKKFTNKDGTTRGTILDKVYRAFMMDEINSVQELTAKLEELSVDEKGKRIFTYSKGFVVNLYDSMQEVHDYLSDMGYKIVADISTLWGEIDGRRAGTIDFLIYNEDKEFAVVDLKTSTINLRNAYENPDKDTYEYQKGHTIQQNGYRELFGQRTGLVPDKLFVLPLLLKKNKAGSVESIKTLPSKSRGLMLTVNMDKDIYELTGVARSSEAFVPGEPKKPTKPPKKSSRKKKTPPTKLEQLNAEVIRLVNIRSNDKVVRQAINDANSGKITLEELDAIKKKWDDENGLTAAIAAYDAEKKKTSPPTTTDIEAKKAEIEARREQSISEIGLAKQGSTGKYVGYYKTQDGKESSIYGNTKENVEERLNKKYDAELAALEGKPTTKVDIEAAKNLVRQMLAGKVITEFTPDEQIILGDPTIITPEIREALVKEFEILNAAKAIEDLERELNFVIDPLVQEKNELEKLLEDEESKRKVKNTVEEEITDEEMQELQEELGVEEEEVKEKVVAEVISQMNEKKPSRAKTVLQKVAKRIKRILLNLMIGTTLLNSMSFTFNNQDPVLTYQTVNVENLESFNSALLDQEAVNRLDNLNIITKSFEDSTENYLIVDKANAVAHLFQGDSLLDTFEVGTGRKVGDAQTRTVVKNGRVLWEQGNQQTGAGIYTVGGIGQYKSSPSYTLKNEEGIEVPTVLHETLENRKKLFGDKDLGNNRMSFGCVNFKAESLKKLATYGNFRGGSKVFVLPDDSTNKFQIIDGNLRFVSQDTNVNRTTRGYAAQSISIKADKESRVVNSFVNAIADNKAKIMSLYPSISNATYNQIASIAYGIMGQESSFGTFGGLRGQYGKVKDDVQAYLNYGVPSVGVTQIRYTSVNNKVKQAFGITSEENIKDNPATAAIATMSVLLDIYENEIPSNLKQDFRSLLPLAYSNRGEFAKAIAGDSSTYENQYVRNVNEFAKGLEVYQGVGTTTPKSETPRQSSKGPLTASLIGLAAFLRKKQESEELSDLDIIGIKERISVINDRISEIKKSYDIKINAAKLIAGAKSSAPSTPTKSEIVKGSVIRMNNGELVQVKNITKGKITVVPLMDDTAAEDVIDEADITDTQIVASPNKKKTVKTTPDVDTKEVIDDSVTQANGLAASKDDQTKLANEAKKMTPAERKAALSEKLKNRCITKKPL